jgi:hypothetical protein
LIVAIFMRRQDALPVLILSSASAHRAGITLRFAFSAALRKPYRVQVQWLVKSEPMADTM